jgi:hypothetical protein
VDQHGAVQMGRDGGEEDQVAHRVQRQSLGKKYMNTRPTSYDPKKAYQLTPHTPSLLTGRCVSLPVHLHSDCAPHSYLKQWQNGSIRRPSPLPPHCVPPFSGSSNPKLQPVSVLAVAPTSELAIQTHDTLHPRIPLRHRQCRRFW